VRKLAYVAELGSVEFVAFGFATVTVIVGFAVMAKAFGE
jgi:hypothetical protein